MICETCGETAQKQKWKSDEPENKFCENCLVDGQETPYIQFTMIEE
jgi:hypothetical protein